MEIDSIGCSTGTGFGYGNGLGLGIDLFDYHIIYDGFSHGSGWGYETGE